MDHYGFYTGKIFDAYSSLGFYILGEGYGAKSLCGSSATTAEYWNIG